MLYRPEAFEPLADLPWEEQPVREAIREIVADTDGAYRPGRLWPADEWDGWESPLPLKTLYVGAAGVVWALDRLRRHGHAETALDLAVVAREGLAAWRQEPGVLTVLEQPEPANASLLVGEAGILTVLWRLAPEDAAADALHSLVCANATNAANDVMWGAPGTMLAAQEMLTWTGDVRWADAWRASAAALMKATDEEGLWLQKLYGESYRGLGPLHGATGNVVALLRSPELLSADESSALRRATAAVLARTALLEHGLANWPGAVGSPLLLAPDGEIRLQWDCGAPGVVWAAASYVDEELVLAGAELVWRAGAHGAEKGAGICHGTAGNGYALLAAFERTQDERWLERARLFARHALEQSRRARETRGRGRYSLWTGDVGVAIFAADCLEARARYPVLDGWE